MLFSFNFKLLINTSPYQSKNPKTITPDSIPTTIGAAIIVDRMPIPRIPKPIVIVIKELSMVSVIFTQRLSVLDKTANFSCSLLACL